MRGEFPNFSVPNAEQALEGPPHILEGQILEAPQQLLETAAPNHNSQISKFSYSLGPFKLLSRFEYKIFVKSYGKVQRVQKRKSQYI